MSKVRIIAGSSGGLSINIPPRFSSRPTQDRIREALFSSLGDRIQNIRLLDLYSGSGALGIEALSRGAAHVTFVELNKRYCQTIKQNLAFCKIPPSSFHLIPSDSIAYLKKTPTAPFDIIFLDPPYTKEKCDLSEHPAIPLLLPFLSENGLIIWEHDSMNSWKNFRSPEKLKQKKYGNTTLTHIHYDQLAHHPKKSLKIPHA